MRACARKILNEDVSNQTLFIYFFLKILFIYSWETERERQREKQAPKEQRARCGTRSQDPGIVTWAEGRRLTDWATQASHEPDLKDSFLLPCSTQAPVHVLTDI